MEPDDMEWLDQANKCGRNVPMVEQYYYPKCADETLTIREAYWTAFRFLDAYWQRQGRDNPDALPVLLGQMQPAVALPPSPDKELMPMTDKQWDAWVRAWKAGK